MFSSLKEWQNVLSSLNVNTSRSLLFFNRAIDRSLLTHGRMCCPPSSSRISGINAFMYASMFAALFHELAQELAV